MVLSEVLITFIITSVIGCSLAVIKIFYKFKFENISFCGNCLKVTRDIKSEEVIDQLKINNSSQLISTPSVRTVSLTNSELTNSDVSNNNSQEPILRIDDIHRVNSITSNRINNMNNLV